MDTNQLQIIAINLTRRCNLSCEHCYLDADELNTPSANELSTQDVKDLLDQIAQHHEGTMIVLTGGEPLIRTDLEQLCSHGKSLGLMVVIGSNGALLTERRVISLKNAGAMGIGISVDSLDPARHDAFRGQTGSWLKTMSGIEHCRKHQLDFQIHFSITDDNHHEIEDIINFAEMSGARVVNFFFIICTGRAESVGNISTVNYEAGIKKIIECQNKYENLIIRPRCAPYFKRVAWQMAPESALNRISGQEGDGCIAGTHYCRVTPEGDVTACPYIEKTVGNIKQQDFQTIWNTAEDFLSLRNPQLTGKCGECEFQKLCGGCRARPLAAGKQLMDEDTSCGYIPHHGDIIEPVTDFETANLIWSDDASKKLNRIPGFIRNMVKKRTETYVLDLGEELITIAHMQQLSAKRFGNNLPWKRPQTVTNSDSESGENP
ncbi:MAG: radical SAM protein [Gammaproteobacteria bacterium]|jgi:radical SAM protein with 4Fe4S-binding SPASM domain|nr:radical SAM protein [Gammaproteobacteria bacterium]MBT3722087.1 radical SAM protein [Gammaproteobacteria bacterium]MBT4195979.1 radical SAM protein [Gammaproteobacteria bacterium]MBT4451549.1 radical SAM protein [Gammaproteobacteria bacterium]MBT4860209.1 radical SAM protein [Gammaproteobacteria bacterium]